MITKKRKMKANERMKAMFNDNDFHSLHVQAIVGHISVYTHKKR